MMQMKCKCFGRHILKAAKLRAERPKSFEGGNFWKSHRKISLDHGMLISISHINTLNLPPFLHFFFPFSVLYMYTESELIQCIDFQAGVEIVSKDNALNSIAPNIYFLSLSLPFSLDNLQYFVLERHSTSIEPIQNCNSGKVLFRFKSFDYFSCHLLFRLYSTNHLYTNIQTLLPPGTLCAFDRISLSHFHANENDVNSILSSDSHSKSFLYFYVPYILSNIYRWRDYRN